jgi:hypothetical protein
MLKNPTWSAVYAPRGYLLVEGEYIKRTAYGQTLEKIAKHGADVFYTGDIAKSTVKTLKSLGGIMTMDDVRKSAILLTPARTLPCYCIPCHSSDIQQQVRVHHLCANFRRYNAGNAKYPRAIRL